MIISLTTAQQESIKSSMTATIAVTSTAIARATSPEAIETYKVVIKAAAIAVALVAIAVAVAGYKTGKLARALFDAYQSESNRSEFLTAVSDAAKAERDRYQPVADTVKIAYGIGYVFVAAAIAGTQGLKQRVARVASEVRATLPMGLVSIQ